MLAEYKEYIENLKLDHSEHTISSYKYSIEPFINYYNIKNIDDIKKITTKQCREFLNYLKEAGLSNNSINSRLRPLKAFFNFLSVERYIDESSWSNVKELRIPRRNPAFLSYDEIDLLVKNCKNLCEKTMFTLYITSGLRREELIKLKINDIIDNGHINVIGKGNKQRILGLQDSVYELLKEYVESRNEKWGNKYDNIFISNQGRPFTGSGIYRKFKSLCNRSGIPEERINVLHPHSMRHTFATNMLESGCDIKILQVGLGHANMKTTSDIYSHVRNTALDNAIKNQRKIL